MDSTRTSAKPIVVNGIEWFCYRTGVLRYEWRAEAINARAGSNYNKATYWAIVDDVKLPTKFRSIKKAMTVAIAQAKKPEGK